MFETRIVMSEPFLKWCEEWDGDFRLYGIKTFAADMLCALEVHNLTPDDQCLWIIRWNEQTARVLAPTYRTLIKKPYREFSALL